MRTMPMSFHAMEMYEYEPRTWVKSMQIHRRNKKQINALLGRDFTIPVLIFAIALILAFCSWCTSANAEGNVMYVCVHASSHLNGRAKPSKNSEITMKLYNGEEVEVVDIRSDGWIEIVGGETGTSFVSDKYVSQTIEQYKVTNVSDGRIKVRETIDGKVVDYVKKGETVTILQTMSEWGRISKGWVKLEYFE